MTRKKQTVLVIKRCRGGWRPQRRFLHIFNFFSVCSVVNFDNMLCVGGMSYERKNSLDAHIPGCIHHAVSRSSRALSSSGIEMHQVPWTTCQGKVRPQSPEHGVHHMPWRDRYQGDASQEDECAGKRAHIGTTRALLWLSRQGDLHEEERACGGCHGLLGMS